MTCFRRTKQCIAVTLTLLMLLMTVPGGMLKVKAAENDKTTLDISKGSITIGNCTVSQSGQSPVYNVNGYIITGSTTVNTVSVTGGSQDITLSGLNIDVSSKYGACAFSIVSGASVNLTLSGSNTLKSGRCSAGLQVPVGAAVDISGTDSDSLMSIGGGGNSGSGAGIGGGNIGGNSGGSVTVYGGRITAIGSSFAAGIGGAMYGSGGNVTITGGSVTAIGKIDGAGIGGGGNGSGGNIAITGGIVSATGSWYGAGIGGCEAGSGGNVIISGGIVSATGGDCGGTGIGGGTYGSCGDVTISGGTVTANGVSGSAGIGGGRKDSAGKITITGGSVHASSVQGTVKDASGAAEYCVTAKVPNLSMAAFVTYSVNGGKTFSCKTDSLGQLYVWAINGDNKATICCGKTYYGANATVSDRDTSTDAGAMTVLNLTGGDIAITDGSVTGTDINGNAAFPNPYGYIIAAAPDIEGRNVSVSGGTHNIVLKSLTVNDKFYLVSPFSVTGTASVYLTLSGENILKSYFAGVEVTGGASVSITGTDYDSLEAGSTNFGAGIGGIGDGTDSNNCGTVKISGGKITALGSKNCAGIGGAFITKGGNCGNVTVSGGTVDAEGGIGAAGIGGSSNGSASNITITGGTVKAIGSDGGAGIGGGMYQSGRIAITGGTVTSTAVEGTSYKKCGSGIGDGYNTADSAVRIAGGSVNTSGISVTPTWDGTTPVYSTAVTLPAAVTAAVSSLSVKQGDSSISYGINDMKTDSSGKLYLYLPASSSATTADLTADGTSYNYYGAVSAENSNTLKMDQDTFIVRTDKDSYIYGDVITVFPSGGSLSGTPDYTYYDVSTGHQLTGKPSDAGSYKVSATLSGNASYYDTTATTNFEISPKSINDFTVDGIENKTYTGGTVNPSGLTVSDPSGAPEATLAEGSDYTISYPDSDYINAGNGKTVIINGMGNYTGRITQTFNIVKRTIALSLSAVPNGTAKAESNISLTAAVSNAVDLPKGTVTFKNDDTIKEGAVISQNDDGTYTATTSWDKVPAGNYDITAEYVTADNDNYECTASGLITDYSVTKYDQSGFGFPDGTITKTYGDDDFTVSASGGQGSGNVVYESSDKNIATVTDSGVVTIKSAGALTVTAKKASDSVYNEAVDTIAINIGKAATFVKTIPTAADIAVVGKLSSVALTGGESSVPGSFSWSNPDMTVSESGEYNVIFTPADSINYFACTCKVKVMVLPQIKNDKTGVIYDLSDTELPDSITSVSVKSSIVSAEGSESESYTVAGSLINDISSSAKVSGIKIYELSLVDKNGNTVKGFTGRITVKIPIPSGMSGNLHVYWYNDVSGTVTDMNAKQENGYLVFDTTHFSYYAVAELKTQSAESDKNTDNPHTGDNNPLCGYWLLTALPIVFGTVFMVKRRRFRFKRKP